MKKLRKPQKNNNVNFVILYGIEKDPFCNWVAGCGCQPDSDCM